MDLLGNRPLKIEFALSILYYGEKNDNPTHPGYVPTLNVWQEKILRLCPVQQSNLSAVLNGGQLERNANIANSKKSGTSCQHLCP